MEAIKQDQKTTLEECRLRRQYDAAKIEELLEKVKKLQDFSRENTRELIEVKKAHKIFERRSKEERTKMLTDLANSRQRLGEEKGRNDTIETVCFLCCDVLRSSVF
jgi:DNA repair exonuclease SbcCD ATPase subunit